MVEIGQKTDFLGHFESFLFTLSYTLWVKPQDFAKWKTLRYKFVVDFISIDYVVVTLKIFKVFRNNWASLKGPLFGVFFDPYFLRYCSILMKFWPEVVSNKTNILLKKSFKILYSDLNETHQSLQFWSILGPNLPWENQKYC